MISTGKTYQPMSCSRLMSEAFVEYTGVVHSKLYALAIQACQYDLQAMKAMFTYIMRAPLSMFHSNIFTAEEDHLSSAPTMEKVRDLDRRVEARARDVAR